MSQHYFAADSAPTSARNPLPASPLHPVPERSTTATIGAILLAVFFLSTGSALQGTAVVLRSGIEGFSEPVIGITMAAFYLGFLAGLLVSPFVLTAGGYGRTFAGFASIASAGALAHLLIMNPTAWITLRFVHGYCIASMLVIAERWMVSATPRKSGAMVLGLYSTMYIAAMGIGQPLLGVFGSGGFRLFLIVSILTSLSLVPLTVIRGNGVLNLPLPSTRLKRAFLVSPVSSIGLMAAGFLSSSIWSLGPRYGRAIGLETMETGLFMAAIAVGAVLSLGVLSVVRGRWTGRTPIALLMSIGTIASLVLLVGASFDFPVYFSLALVSGACIMPLYSLSVARAREQIGTRALVSTAGTFVIFFSFGAIFGPLVSSLAMAAFGPGGLFGTIVLVQASVLAAVVRGTVQFPVPADGTSACFQPYPPTTHTVFSLIEPTSASAPADRHKGEPDEGSSDSPELGTPDSSPGLQSGNAPNT
ncbi:MAG: MFS transporter, partial [Spirochaetia bacterium]